MKQAILIIFSIFEYIGAAAQLSVQADKQSITVGEAASISIQAVVDKHALTVWPSLPDSFNHLEIINRGQIDTTSSGTMLQLRQTIILSGFDSGVYAVPSLTLVVSSGARTDSFRSEEIPIWVQTLAVDTTQPAKPIVDIVAVEISWWEEYKAYVLIAAGILLLGTLLFFLLKRKKPTIPEPVLPALSLHERTLAALRAVEADGLISAGAIKEYYSRITDIIRQYLEKRFGIAAPERTTEELLELAEQDLRLASIYAALSFVLHTADAAKFARALPAQKDHTDAMEAARQIVLLTKPAIVQETASPVSQRKA